MSITYHYIDNGEGWKLECKRTVDPEPFDPERPPLLIVPGYGMNAFIFGYHPTGASMEAYFAAAGLEVWSANLRNQGGSIRVGGHKSCGLWDYGVTDLSAVATFIAENTASAHKRVDAIGCSLGGTLIFMQAALVEENRLGALVNMGGPLAWRDPHALLRTAASFPRLWGAVRFEGTRRLAGVLFPLLLRVPFLLRGYLHAEIVDTSRPQELVKTVDDPNPVLNRQLAEWIRDGDLRLDGQNLTEAMRRVSNPLLTVVANADGIVPEQTTLSAHNVSAAREREVLRVGDDVTRFAHADLFISRYSQERVFQPINRWLAGLSRDDEAAGAR
ncbi:MAG: alpha/beta fold hydrolase [Myxococcales bacterium]|nr:alpha/beta fold hydrolase [Myxococcales bacterium]